MVQLACPHCGLPAFSPLRKLALGPAAKLACRRCGLAVGVAVGPALLSFVPSAAIVVAVLAHWLRDPATMIVLAVAAIAATSALYLWWVPLAPRELTRRDAVEAARRRP
jgi:hypothetical protein